MATGQSVFRKVALDRLSSPEELDQVLRVTTPHSWIALSAFMAATFVALAWAVLGEVTTQVGGDGVIVRVGSRDASAQGPDQAGDRDDSEELIAVVYVAASEVKSISPGLEAQVSPSNAKREEFGFIRGTVLSVADFPASRAVAMRTLDNETLVESLVGRSPVTEVKVRLTLDPGTASGYSWSSGKGPALRLTPGTLSRVQFTTSRQSPISLVLPLVR